MKLPLRFHFGLYVLAVSVSGFLSAQTGPNWALDPHAGIASAFLQPAATVDIPYAWDANLISASGFFRNDYSYLRSTSAFGFVRDLRQREGFVNDEASFEFQLNGTTYNYDYNRQNTSHSASLSGEILGPALSIQIGSRTRIGGFLRTRAVASVRNVDPILSYYNNQDILSGTTYSVDAIFVAAAAWSEAGINASRAFLVSDDAELRLGVNLRYLIPHEGAVFDYAGGGEFTKTDGDSLLASGAYLEVAFSQGLREEAFKFRWSGTGLAADLGVQYAWESFYGGGYRYSLGLSLLDYGQFNFGSVNQTHRFRNNGTAIIDADNYTYDNPESYLDEAVRQLSRDANGGNPNGSQTGSTFQLGLPTTLSLQFAFRPDPDVQLALAYRGDVPWGNKRLTRGQDLVATAHYSRRWYGGGLSTSVVDWRYVNVGLQLRAGPVFFGTDQLFGTVLPTAQLRGAHFYFGLRVHNWKPPGTRSGRSPRSRGSGSKRVRCYEF